MLYKDLLALDVYQFLLVATRMAVVVMMMPGVSAPYVSTRIRLSLSLTVSLLILPVVAPFIPPIPRTSSGLFLLIFSEVTVGVFIGLVMQMLMAALNLAGTTISTVSGLSSSTMFDPISEQQSSIIVGIFGNLAVLLIFATNMHHLIFEAVVGSYSLMQPGKTLMVGDFSQVLVTLLDRSFVVGTQLSAPFIVGSTVFQAGLGLMARLMPQMNVFFVGLPLQILLALALLMITIPPVMATFLSMFRDGLIGFLAPG
ncbi:MAG: flagellar biosynthetic protein FliR [Alphaproteobacteria bacterium]